MGFTQRASSGATLRFSADGIPEFHMGGTETTILIASPMGSVSEALRDSVNQQKKYHTRYDQFTDRAVQSLLEIFLRRMPRFFTLSRSTWKAIARREEGRLKP